MNNHIYIHNNIVILTKHRIFFIFLLAQDTDRDYEQYRHHYNRHDEKYESERNTSDCFYYRNSIKDYDKIQQNLAKTNARGPSNASYLEFVLTKVIS